MLATKLDRIIATIAVSVGLLFGVIPASAQISTGGTYALEQAAIANGGGNSALYGAMGFVRKSERASGLTRKKVTP